MKRYAFVFARGGSKGVPGKNIKPLAGKPLIGYSIELAKNHPMIDEVYVSTDDKGIAQVAESFGAKVIERPIELAQDKSPEWLAWQHAVAFVSKQESSSPTDMFISLPATSPLRDFSDITAAIETYDNKACDLVLGITESARSPYFNMVRFDQNDNLQVVNGKERFERRQDVPAVFDITTVAYVTSFDFIERSTGLFDGKVAGFKVPADRAIDIDTPLDFKIAEFLMMERVLHEEHS